jgi:dihydrofolate reductase
VRIVIVAAVGRNCVIGVDGRLPWRIPEDLARFKAMTMGHALVMGRATFESIGRPLPGRSNVVLTHRPGWSHEGVEAAGSFPEAVAIAAHRGQDVYVAGGADVYRQALEVADAMELTEVDAAPGGDTWFPEVNWASWEETGRVEHPGFDFATYERV